MYNLQLHYMKDLNKSDIMANFMVGGDGRTYEGCGWNCKSNYATDNETLTIGLFGESANLCLFEFTVIFRKAV